MKFWGQIIPQKQSIKLHIQEGVAPYTVQMIISDPSDTRYNFIMKTVDNIPQPKFTVAIPDIIDDINCEIIHIPSGHYRMIVTDSVGNDAMATLDIEPSPYIRIEKLHRLNHICNTNHD